MRNERSAPPRPRGPALPARASPLQLGEEGEGRTPRTRPLTVARPRASAAIYFSRGRTRTDALPVPPARDLWSAYRAIGGPQPRKFRPSRPAGRRPGGRSLTRQRGRKRCCQLPGAVRIYEGERRSSARSDTFACPVETTHPRDPRKERSHSTRTLDG